MKIKILSLVAVIATCGITFNARAATMCGPVDSDGRIWHKEITPYKCLKSDNINDRRDSEIGAYNDTQSFGKDGLCVTYTSIIQDPKAENDYLTHCTISSWACGNKYYYAGTNNCQPCPDGYIGTLDGEYHTTTSCRPKPVLPEYQCEYNQYDTGTGCAPCPGNNAAAADPGELHNYDKCNICYDDRYYYDAIADTCRLCPQNGLNIGDNEIDRCYITGGSDETGTYKYTENCYWSTEDNGFN